MLDTGAVWCCYAQLRVLLPKTLKWITTTKGSLTSNTLGRQSINLKNMKRRVLQGATAPQTCSVVPLSRGHEVTRWERRRVTCASTDINDMTYCESCAGYFEAVCRPSNSTREILCLLALNPEELRQGMVLLLFLHPLQSSFPFLSRKVRTVYDNPAVSTKSLYSLDKHSLMSCEKHQKGQGFSETLQQQMVTPRQHIAS